MDVLAALLAVVATVIAVFVLFESLHYIKQINRFMRETDDFVKRQQELNLVVAKNVQNLVSLMDLYEGEPDAPQAEDRSEQR